MLPTKNKLLQLTSSVLTCAVLASCSSDVSNPPPLNSGTASAGDADFSNFVAIGDSLTAGYADGALYLLGQTNSFPNMLSQQFAEVGGGAFVQPLLADGTDPAAAVEANLGGLLLNGVPDLVLNRFVLNTETEAPERLEGATTLDVVGTGLNGTAFNNMGVPGAKVIHLDAAGYGNAAGLPAAVNPYFVRFASSGAADMLSDATNQMPSFYTLWIGNNDVLGDATSGGDGSDPLTDPAVFQAKYDSYVAAFKAANAAVQGVLVNIPDVSTIPYFTTVPYNALPLDQATADAINASYAAYNAGVAMALAADPDEVAQRTINFVEGQNAVVIEDETLTDLSGVGLPSYRHATADDLILLPASAYIGTEDESTAGTTPPAGFPWGIGTGLEDGDVLIPSELEAIETARVAFNATIKAAADADANLVLYDAAADLTTLRDSGINFGTGSITSEFATGGGFSLDGVHPTARGYAVIANGIIDVINTGFNANVYKVDPAIYPTVFLK